MKQINLQRDMMADGGVYDVASKSDIYESKKLLLKVIMEKAKITDSDLDDISIVKSKLRSLNIDLLID